MKRTIRDLVKELKSYSRIAITVQDLEILGFDLNFYDLKDEDAIPEFIELEAHATIDTNDPNNLSSKRVVLNLYFDGDDMGLPTVNNKFGIFEIKIELQELARCWFMKNHNNDLAE